MLSSLGLVNSPSFCTGVSHQTLSHFSITYIPLEREQLLSVLCLLFGVVCSAVFVELYSVVFRL